MNKCDVCKKAEAPFCIGFSTEKGTCLPLLHICGECFEEKASRFYLDEVFSRLETFTTLWEKAKENETKESGTG